MAKWKSIGACAAIATLLGTTVSFAEVTAVQIWGDWKAYLESFGYTVTSGSEQTSGGILSVRDITFGVALPEGTILATMPQIDFKERGDGTVSVLVPEEYSMRFEAESEDDESVEMDILFTQTGLSVIASGDAQNTVYDFSAPSYGLSINEIMAQGESIPLNIAMNMAGVAGKYTFVQGELREITSRLDAEKLTINVRAQDPSGNGNVVMNASVSGITSLSETAIPDLGGLNMEDPSALFKEGLSLTGGFAHKGIRYDLSGSGDGETFTMKGKSDAGSLNFGMDWDAISYGGTSKGIDLTVSGSEIPIPEVSLSLADSAFNLRVPLSKSDTPEDFSFLLKMAGLSVSDMIWSIIDPGQNLPRDPLTLIVDLSGQLSWDVDLLDPASADALDGDEFPGQLYTFNLNALKLSAAGAELTGSGNFTFDNSDTVTFDGLPRPIGKLAARLKGANALMDKLIAMGLLPEDQAMGARLMMGMFARPGADEDTLTSTLELTEEGGIVANGQRIK